MVNKPYVPPELVEWLSSQYNINKPEIKVLETNGDVAIENFTRGQTSVILRLKRMVEEQTEKTLRS